MAVSFNLRLLLKRYKKFLTKFYNKSKKNRINSKVMKAFRKSRPYLTKSSEILKSFWNWRNSRNKLPLLFKWSKILKTKKKKKFAVALYKIKKRVSRNYWRRRNKLQITVKNGGLWEFLLNPLIFWSIYYFNKFFIYYFKTLFYVWIRFFFRLANYRIVNFDYLEYFFVSIDFIWFYSIEQLCESKYRFSMIQKQLYYFNVLFNSSKNARNSTFNLPFDLLMHFRSIKYTFCHKKTWNRRYKFIYGYMQLLKAHLFKTREMGGWSRMSSRKIFDNYTYKRLKWSTFYNLFLLALNKWAVSKSKSPLLEEHIRSLRYNRFFKSIVDYGREFIQRQHKLKRKKSLELPWIAKSVKLPRPVTLIKLLLGPEDRRPRIKRWFNGRMYEIFLKTPSKKSKTQLFQKGRINLSKEVQTIYKTVEPALQAQLDSLKKGKNLFKASKLLISKKSSGSQQISVPQPSTNYPKKEYSPEQKLIFSRYKRFKARTGVSCSFFDWQKNFQNTKLEEVARTSEWLPEGWRISSADMATYFSSTPKKK